MNIEELKHLTDEELLDSIKKFETEYKLRSSTRTDKAIENFVEAYNHLLEAIHYCNGMECKIKLHYRIGGGTQIINLMNFTEMTKDDIQWRTFL